MNGVNATRHVEYEQFLGFAEEDTWAEWVERRVVTLRPASDRHQDLVRFLLSVLGVYCEVRGLGVVRPAPCQMKLPRSGREPDLLFVRREHLDCLKESHLEGPADLVVGVVSRDSGPRDRGEKFYEHEEAGVGEYWLVDPDRRELECYQLSEKARYRLASGGSQGTYHSCVVEGFWIRAEWLWQEPLPKVLDAVQELGLV